MDSNDEVRIACPECKSDSFERVVSRSSHVMGVGHGGKKQKMTTKSCSPGNQCMTLDLPGPAPK
jgi:hypothetical protein